ncbi:CYFA0S03e06458g1_1 [Cyberlindnera fabianii]|uniref:CYFA0S03e06458g1_1 n=1 Tax=Cyberlindnera fabianii TaxID=36022 RepID=A0A061AY98_CYBFA|nr:CYFA0S03e06458g1_1 [Cyberlindnera fabianii]
MSIMAEQYYDLHNGRDYRSNEMGSSLNNSSMASSHTENPHQGSPSEMYLGMITGGQAMPPINVPQTLPQIVFTHPNNYNTIPPYNVPKNIYNTANPLGFPSTAHHPRSAPQSHNSLQINTLAPSDALSSDSITSQSMQSKNSISSFSDLRFPEPSDSTGNLVPSASGYNENSQTRSPYDNTLSNLSPWSEHSRVSANDHLHRTHSHPIQHDYYPVHQSPHQTHSSSSELTDQQVKNLLMITNTTSSSTGKRKPRTKHELSPSQGQESFTCKHCGKAFAKGYNLKSHLKTHSDERPFQCSFCDRSFARNHDKKRHELLHQGVKKFQCGGVLKDKITRWGCGKRFSRADGLGRHFRTDIGWLCIRPLMLEAKEMERQENEKADIMDEATFGTTFINDLLKKSQ